MTNRITREDLYTVTVQFQDGGKYYDYVAMLFGTDEEYRKTLTHAVVRGMNDEFKVVTIIAIEKHSVTDMKLKAVQTLFVKDGQAFVQEELEKQTARIKQIEKKMEALARIQKLADQLGDNEESRSLILEYKELTGL